MQAVVAGDYVLSERTLLKVEILRGTSVIEAGIVLTARPEQAVVELVPGQSVSAEEIIALCKDQLGSVMAPKSVDFVPALPRSPVGKVLKKDLRAAYWQGHDKKI